MLLVKGISDITCGFKGFKTSVGQDLFQRQMISNWSFDAELLFLAQALGYKIKELPVTWFDAEGTKVKLYRDIIGSLIAIFQIRRNYLFGHYNIPTRSDHD
jgi:dolichyl-phosphate beta-glucosyltransferase